MHITISNSPYDHALDTYTYGSIYSQSSSLELYHSFSDVCTNTSKHNLKNTHVSTHTMDVFVIEKLHA